MKFPLPLEDYLILDSNDIDSIKVMIWHTDCVNYYFFQFFCLHVYIFFPIFLTRWMYSILLCIFEHSFFVQIKYSSRAIAKTNLSRSEGVSNSLSPSLSLSLPPSPHKSFNVVYYMPKVGRNIYRLLKHAKILISYIV